MAIYTTREPVKSLLNEKVIHTKKTEPKSCDEMKENTEVNAEKNECYSKIPNELEKSSKML